MVADIAGRRIDDTLYLTFMSFLAPPAVLAVGMADGQVRSVGSRTLPWDPGDFVSEQVFVASDDGTRVPLFLSRRRDVEPDGDVRTLLYGYGGFQIATGPTFKPEWLAWMERGGLLAVASLRGGSEYGKAWHDAGRLANKQNVFDDFAACARWLAGSGWTRPERIGISGRSNGGLLVGASITQHPELFGAAIAEVGVMDMLRFHQFTIGWGWTSDYGSPDDPDDFRTLFAYSPLHNCRPGSRIPADARDDRRPRRPRRAGALVQVRRRAAGGPGRRCADPHPGRHRCRARHGQADLEADRRAHRRPGLPRARARLRAAVRDRYGSLEVVELRDVERPVPAGDEVLVRVEAASVNRADLDYIYPKPGFVRLLLGVRRPRNPRLGLDAAGVVESVGPSVTRFTPGDRVFADLYPFSQGALAEYVAAPERAFAVIPPAMSFEVAATLPHSAILAIQGLRTRDGRTVGPGDRVLIDGASGNVGPFAVQIAKSRGAEVTGVCSPAKMDFVRSLGADHVLDYTAVDYTRTGERYDWILDTDSHHSIPRIRRALRPRGVYVTLGGTGAAILAAMTVGPVASLATDKSMGLMLWWKPFHAADVATIVDLVAAGKVTPAIDRRYPLGEVVEALRYVDGGHARGKVIVEP